MYSLPAFLGDGEIMPHAVTVRVRVGLQCSRLTISDVHHDQTTTHQRHRQCTALTLSITLSHTQTTHQRHRQRTALTLSVTL